MKGLFRLILVASIPFALTACGNGISERTISNAIEKWAASGDDAFRMQMCKRFMTKLEGGAREDKYLVQAGYMRQNGRFMELTEEGKRVMRKVPEGKHGDYMGCLFDASVVDVPMIETEKMHKIPTGEEIFRVGVNIKLTPSELGKRVFELAAAEEGISYEKQVSLVRRSEKDVFNAAIRMAKTKDGLKVFDTDVY